MGVRLDPSDEYMHELGPEPNFNESMYVNFFDPDNKVGGFFRIGNRANEGYAEMTICLYLPDGRVGFMFKRPEISNNDAFDAGGMRWTMITPFEELRVDYDGKVVLLDDPLADGRSEEGVHQEPVRRVRGRHHFHRSGPPRCSAASPTSRTRRRARSSPRATTSSSSPAPARSASANDEWVIDGFGLRDHSWGPRFWQAPWYYRWLTANVGEDFGFMAQPRRPPRRAEGTRGGFVWEDGQMHYCDDVELSTELRRRRAVPRADHCGAALVAVEQGVAVHGRGDEPHPAAQPPAGSRRQLAGDSDQRGHDPSGRIGRRAAWATACPSTSTRSSTARRSGLAE